MWVWSCKIATSATFGCLLATTLFMSSRGACFMRRGDPTRLHGRGRGEGMTALCIQGMREEGADRQGMWQSLDLLRLTRDVLVPRPSGERKVYPIRLSCRIVTRDILVPRPSGERKVHPIRLSCRIVSTSATFVCLLATTPLCHREAHVSYAVAIS